MILINLKTHQILEITKITSAIVYTLFENPFFRKRNNGVVSSKVWQLDENLMPNASLSFRDNKFKLAYEYLLSLDEFKDFKLTTDQKTWIHSTRVDRLFINNSAIMKAIEADDSFNTIIQRLRNENLLIAEKFIIIGEHQTVVYANGILPDDQTVIGHLIGIDIFIENKNI